MRWPWARRRRDRAGYTDVIVSSLVAAAGGQVATSGPPPAIVDSIATIYGNVFARAVVAPERARLALSPAVLGNIADQCVRRGEALHLVEVDGAGIHLTPAATWRVLGASRDRSRWRYELDIPSPDGRAARLTVPGSRVMHTAWRWSMSQPWRGTSPATGSSTGAALHALEASWRASAAAPAGQILVGPQGISDVQLAKLEGGTAAIADSSSAVAGSGRPQSVATAAFGFSPAAPVTAARTALAEHLVAAFGLSADVMTAGSNAQSRRAAYQQWVRGAAQGFADRVAESASEALGVEVTLDLVGAIPVDLQAAARTVKTLTDAGMGLDQALQKAGLA